MSSGVSHREGALGEEGAHVALAAEARQAQALSRLLHDVPHRPKQRRFRAALRRLRKLAQREGTHFWHMPLGG